MQRIGWVMMLLVAVAALLGLFGRGPLSSAHLGVEGSPLRADYERFLRLDSPAQLTVYIGAAGVRPDSTVELWLDRTWLAGMQVKAITPDPQKTRVGANQVTYTFHVDPSATPARITYDLETRSFGMVKGRLGLMNGSSYSFSQFAYP